MSDDGSIEPTRVLLVEDHEAFRSFVRSKLRELRDLLLVGETGNGLDAVSTCLTLQPGVVLIDIGLPGLNGIEAARRIDALVPTCKIVFLTQESSSEIVHEALSLGAAGYVVKAHAASDLLPAIAAACEGRRFVSQVVALRNGDGREVPAADHHSRDAFLPPQPSSNHSHPVHFHPDEASLLAGFTGFIEDTLTAGKAAIAITTKPHRKQILQALQARGLDASSVMDQGRLVLLDVDATLARFMVDGLPDPTRFLQVAGDLVQKVKATNHGTRVFACGEISPTLWARGNGAAAIQVERLWDQLVRMYDLESVCGYILTSSQRKCETYYDEICAAHTSIRSF